MGKYTEQAKLAAVRDYRSGEGGLKAIAQRHNVDVSSLRQWIAGYRTHGEAGVVEKKREFYGVELKLSVLKRVREEGLSHRQAAALFNIRRFNIIGRWEQQYNEGGPEALSWGSRGRRRKMTKNAALQNKAQQAGDARSHQELLDELHRLRMENAYLKKLKALSSERAVSARERTKIVLELRQQYPLAGLLKVAGLARSTFYYQQKALQMVDKYADLKVKIRMLFDQHKGRYGYRRITAVIRRDGHLVNHKTVRRLMVQLQLKSCVRAKKYRAYRGQLGHVAPNVLERRFEARRPNEKWVTDVTEFNVGGQKLYLSPIMDLYNGEIVSYEIARRPLFNMVSAMLGKAFNRLQSGDKPVLHSDQGWQYRMPEYRRRLEERAITQSMSRRGNCLDNAAIESFFGTLKSEFYYLNEFRDVEELRTGIESYIKYYNHDRIKIKLQGFSPVEYRAQFAKA
ncbi:IS3 family transposase [Paraburkholderia adhaesiva]|uniref:IS3 family transposase n=1 Tax=Paraburkholderia adhaesiva TaxID=2883244 RepID=UPI00357176F9